MQINSGGSAQTHSLNQVDGLNPSNYMADSAQNKSVSQAIQENISGQLANSQSGSQNDTEAIAQAAAAINGKGISLNIRA